MIRYDFVCSVVLCLSHAFLYFSQLWSRLGRKSEEQMEVCPQGWNDPYQRQRLSVREVHLVSGNDSSILLLLMILVF